MITCIGNLPCLACLSIPLIAKLKMQKDTSFCYLLLFKNRITGGISRKDAI